jgi:heme-degrading monooxygenase HmoA
MAIRMTNHAPGMTTEAYDEAMSFVGDALRGSDGFIAHAAEATAEGMTVTEIWETREQWSAWFDASVRPHLPSDAPDPEVVELHDVLRS